jgi:hypothetical protein
MVKMVMMELVESLRSGVESVVGMWGVEGNGEVGRRLADDDGSSSMPGWVDFLVVAVLILFFYKLLQALMAMSRKWTE